jgi:L-threonylcarbamoyladenylate synthase
VSELTKALDLLRAGELVGMPTETVYGLAGDARNAAAIAKIFALKGRPTSHPLIVHLADAEQIRAWAADIPEHAWNLAAKFWPGPMTLILKKLPGVLAAVTGGQDTVGLRVPAHPMAHALLTAFDDGLAAPSANRFGRISPTSAVHVRQEFNNDLALVLDGGACDIGIESTIIDARDSTLRILRPGSISPDVITAAGHRVERGQTAHSPRVSGALESHYAPRTPAVMRTRAVLFRDIRPNDVALCIDQPSERNSAKLEGITLSHEPGKYAQAMYASLRALDARQAARILIEAPPATDAWDAINDRLGRACADSSKAT